MTHATQAATPRLILASSSVYRRELLMRLQIPFAWAAPAVDETPLPFETPAATAERLAVDKARAVAAAHPDALVIGSDQVAYIDKQRFGKPGTRENAIEQLRAMSGQSVIFHTGLCVYNARSGRAHVRGVATEVRYRELSDTEIRRYLEREDALDCAGGVRAEGLGIALLERLTGDDPSALIGLPLIALCAMLRAEGVDLP